MKVTCGQCNAKLNVPETFKGKSAKCPKCQGRITISTDADISPIPLVTPVAESNERTTNLASTRESSVATMTVPAGRQSVASSQTNAATPLKGRNNPVPTAHPPVAPLGKAISAGDWAKLGTDEKRRVLMSGFRSPFQRPVTSNAYRMGLSAAAFVMLLLPVLYLLFIGSIGFAVWYHLTHNQGMFIGVRGRGAVAAFMLYLAPAVVGVIAVVFMFKPLLARPAKQRRTRNLTRQGEPILFEFVTKVCQEVGSPLPKRIDIDNEVNASASFRAGWFSLIRGNDLVLTIGMPLVHGLPLQQFAGVLAHEFGHFSQGAGMRVSFILRSINLWFVRAVYERDSWDESLEYYSQSLDIRIGWILFVARAAVWLSRRFLWCLLMLGNLLTGLIQQQMEFDADRYEVAMSGKGAFAKTFRALHASNIGYGQAFQTLGQIFNEGRLVDDFPKLAQAHTSKLPKEAYEHIEKEIASAPANRFASHPTDRQRIAAAENSPDVGAFVSDLPASALFIHFDAACQGVTEDMYHASMGAKTNKLAKARVDDVIQAETHQDVAWEAMHRYLLNSLKPTRPLALPASFDANPVEVDKAVALIQKARQRMLETVDDYLSLMQIRETESLVEENARHVQMLSRRLSNIDQSLLRKPDSTKLKISKPDSQKAELFQKAAIARICSACSLITQPKIAEKIPDASKRIESFQKIFPALHAIEQQLKSVKSLEDLSAYQSFSLYHHDKVKGNKSILIREYVATSHQMVEVYRGLRQPFLLVDYPFEHSQGKVSIADQVSTDILIAEEVGQVLQACESMVNGIYHLRGRCLSLLALTAEQVESAIGLEPISVPT